MLQVPFKSSVAELYELIWQEGVELAISVIPQAEMGDSFYLPLTRSVHILDYQVYRPAVIFSTSIGEPKIFLSSRTPAPNCSYASE
jgi:hypothetical protein